MAKFYPSGTIANVQAGLTAGKQPSFGALAVLKKAGFNLGNLPQQQQPKSLNETIRDVIMNNFQAQTAKTAETGERLLGAQYDPAILSKYLGSAKFYSPQASIQAQESLQQGIGGLFGGLGIAQAGRQRRLEDLAQSAEMRVKERQETQEKKTEALSQRRQNAIKEYMDFKQRIINEGGTPDLKAGHDLINKIQQSENPEVELSDYFSVAAPFVQKLFAPKGKGGGTATIDGIPVLTPDMKRKAFALGYTAEQISNPTSELYASVFKGERVLPGSTLSDVFNRIFLGGKKLKPSQKITLSPEKPPPSLTINQVLKEAEEELEKYVEKYGVDSPEWNSVREQIIERYPELESFL